LRKRLPSFAEAPSEADGGVEEVGNQTDRTMGFAFHAAVSALRYRHPFQSVILSGTLLLAKPMTKWNRRTPTSVNTARGKARPGMPHSCAPFAQDWGTTLIAQVVFAFHVACPK